jgi:two-component system NtrC family sensor kinase
VNIAALNDQMLVSAFLASIPDHVYFKDRESRFVSVSLSLAQSLGRTVEEVIGKTDFDFFEETLAKGYRERELHIMSSGEALVDQVVKHIWADGRITWSLNIAMPMRNDTGDIVGVFGTNKNVTAAKLMEQELEKANQELRDMSRLAGMAEAATGVVHNVGNVLNGVNVSTNLIAQGLRKFKVDHLRKLCDLLKAHADTLPDFLTQPQGRQLVPFLEALYRDQLANQTHMLDEVASLEQCVGHIKEIVSIQQSYATMRGLVEDIEVDKIVEDALKMSQGAFLRYGVTLRREFTPNPKITGERGKILQILHNLLRNAKHALDESTTIEKAIVIRIEAGAEGMVRVVVQDNGVGILPENLTRIFAQGFTTRKGGHGFGLHSAANAAKEMRGSLHAESEGLGTGASFALELPVAQARIA